jgi:heptaprenylglyceryl phosphate synthase
LSLERLIEKVKKSEDIMHYMPGKKEDLSSKHVTHQYVTAVVNSLDPNFFVEAVRRQEQLIPADDRQGDSIQLDPQMFKVL